jgi:hypothetical protein
MYCRALPRTRHVLSSHSLGRANTSEVSGDPSGVSDLVRTPLKLRDGEFGPTYVDPTENPDHEAINNRRYNLLLEQLRIYDSYPNISWTIWCWKDLGTCGLFHVDTESAYYELIKPFLQKKKASLTS